MGKLQDLKLTVKNDHLFIEAGGFSGRHPVGCKSSNPIPIR
jgi:hypothetical protein